MWLRYSYALTSTFGKEAVCLCSIIPSPTLQKWVSQVLVDNIRFEVTIGLWSYCEKNCPKAFENVSIADKFKGKVIGIVREIVFLQLILGCV
jgi:hypothetical protein